MALNSNDLRHEIIKKMVEARDMHLFNSNNILQIMKDYNKSVLNYIEKWLKTDTNSIGTIDLIQAGREDLTIEHTILHYNFSFLFEREVLDIAQDRLDKASYMLERLNGNENAKAD